jgi:hypothetical protein
VGQTESGKTILSKKLACSVIAQGYDCLVLDPISDPEWYEILEVPEPGKIGQYGFVTADPYVFDRMLWSSKHCFVFIDESGENAGHYDKQFFPWATRSRHLGHSVFFIAQRYQMIAPTIRNQTRFLFMFNQSSSDALLLSQEFNKAELREGSLPQFEYLFATRFQPVVKGRVEIINDWRAYRNKNLTVGTNFANAIL